ncbi:MAG: chorismate synthase, partial [Clostridia bacterium]|nr:chorismate synthase [Clostridia bacterium]
MQSTFGRNLKVTVFGESHAEAIGVTVEGFPAGFPVDEEELARFMARRAPGSNALVTPRKEADTPEFISGRVDGLTTGEPLQAIIRNTNTRSADYAELLDLPRPSHADYPAFVKYGGKADMRGGGHFSARLTAPLCVAGGIARQMLAARGITIGAHLAAVAGVKDEPFDPVNLTAEALLAPGQKPLAVQSDTAGERMAAAVAAAASDHDSVGGVVECAAIGLPVGLGEPLYDGIENRLAATLFGIPAVRGVEFGDGFAAANLRGSEHNDPYIKDGDRIVTAQNHAGGVLGGMTTGMPLIVRVAFKPTPSIGREQRTVRLSTGEETTLVVHGRHDPCVALRAVPCVEAV